ncbi:MAG TPA: DciA family protein [Rhodanobacteraceae bacterium]|nr:DciA family protein [Rhodanobacteraceae bacterium]
MRTDHRRQNTSPRLGTTVSVGDCLRGTEVTAHGMRIADLNRRLRQLRPEAFGDEVELADLRNGNAVVLAPSSAWAARLRQHQRQLRDLLLAMGEQVDVVTVKVAQPQRVPHATAHRKPLSAATATHLREVAASLEDPDLKAGFLRLASLAE